MIKHDMPKKKKTNIEVEFTMSSSDKFFIVGGVLEIGDRWELIAPIKNLISYLMH